MRVTRAEYRPRRHSGAVDPGPQRRWEICKGAWTRWRPRCRKNPLFRSLAGCLLLTPAHVTWHHGTVALKESQGAYLKLKLTWAPRPRAVLQFAGSPSEIAARPAGAPAGIVVAHDGPRSIDL